MVLLLVGLGNPGDQYQNTRHNAGFMVIDHLGNSHDGFSFKSKFSGSVAIGTINNQKIILFKPSTYMNNSGQAVSAVAKFYQIALEDIIVFHDELDVPLGKVKAKNGGGSGGHNGIKSIDAHLGLGYWRVRIGIDHPGDRDLVSDYVLSNFSSAQKKQLSQTLELINANIEYLLNKQFDLFINKIH